MYEQPDNLDNLDNLNESAGILVGVTFGVAVWIVGLLAAFGYFA